MAQEMYLGKNIAYLLRMSNLKQDELGTILGLGKSVIGTYVREKATPNFKVLISIAKYFHISLDDLLMRDIEIDGHFETPKNDVVNKGAASVYMQSEKATDLNAVFKSLIQEELMPMHLEIYNLKRTVEQLKNQ